MVEHVGIVNDSQGFTYADVLADADGWLLAHTMSENTSGLALSDAMRSVYQQSGDARISRFYQERFGSSADNLSAAYQPLMDGIDVGPITNFPLSMDLPKLAAGGESGITSNFPMPTKAQADICARAYAAFLANPHH
jgi:hypothetical protein